MKEFMAKLKQGKAIGEIFAKNSDSSMPPSHYASLADLKKEREDRVGVMTPSPALVHSQGSDAQKQIIDPSMFQPGFNMFASNVFSSVNSVVPSADKQGDKVGFSKESESMVRVIS